MTACVPEDLAFPCSPIRSSGVPIPLRWYALAYIVGIVLAGGCRSPRSGARISGPVASHR
jgi:hypothetical protein